MRVVFLGDSITREWPNDIWNENFASLGAVNLGLAGDRIESLLWRLVHGQWGVGSDALRPSVAVVLIGTNNLGSTSRSEDLASGISAIVRLIRERSPKTVVLTLGLLPRRSTDERTSRLIAETNQRLSTQADGINVVYADIGADLARYPDQVREDFFRDDVHLSEEGYRKMAGALQPLVFRLMKSAM
ncbi:hypothetical protein IBL26_15310 [Roseomonas aerophila]|uniref:SGNH hydrolase-type esterase domain-containing protein n=1 Tax=Teichococcus aerophilus TaxID=1224513 RepID=A0ABR7RPI9_9PROT|nr:hypothetical protein [Pseudoroseomonas aerophila]